VVAGRATELIDEDFYWRRCDGEAERPEAAQAMASQSVGAFVRASKRLLVVDESPFTRMLLGPLLAQAGYEVEVAGDAEAALAMHDAGVAFDLILADTSHAGPSARRMASAFGRASAWHTTPLLGLGTRRMAGAAPEDDGLLADVAEALSDAPHDDQEAA
jgi:two-component system chemotaxis sensor kinase CheA